LIVTVVRLARPGVLRSVVAESLLVKLFRFAQLSQADGLPVH
jgi:hypothetical protein